MDDSFTIHDLPVVERPRERLHAKGADNLSSAELLAILIGRGIAGKSVMTIANELITRFQGVQGIGDATIEQLSAIRGVGLAKAAQIKAAFELGRRRDIEREGTPESITSPAILANMIRKGIQEMQKMWRPLCVSSKIRINALPTIFPGTRP